MLNQYPAMSSTHNHYDGNEQPSEKIVARVGGNLSREELPAAVIKSRKTNLLVEDEEGVLNLCKRILENNEFNVLTAVSSQEAIRIAENHSGNIDLLLTDVMLPEMNGCDLSKMLLMNSPDHQTLFMSGYDTDIIAQYDIVEEESNFIRKPFSMKSLTKTVSEMLDIANAEQA